MTYYEDLVLRAGILMCEFYCSTAKTTDEE